VAYGSICPSPEPRSSYRAPATGFLVRLPEIDVPMLVFQGDHDQVLLPCPTTG
jgi:hypothetical protein